MNSNTISLIKLINSIYAYTQIYLNKNMEEIGLTAVSYSYLLVLNMKEGLSQNEISRELNVNKFISSRTIKKLMELEYITKEENTEDTRAYKLYITDKGKSLITEIINITDTWGSILVQGCEEKESQTSIKFMEKILNNAANHK